MAEVFQVLAQMRDEGIVTDYAVGGATAVLFYAEPTRTYDVDVFALLPSSGESALVSLAPVYRWAESRGFPVDGEHVMVHDVPVRILPAYNPLVVDAIHTDARLCRNTGPCGRSRALDCPGPSSGWRKKTRAGVAAAAEHCRRSSGSARTAACARYRSGDST